MATVSINGHTIQVDGWGTEKVYYDSKLVSSKFSMGGANHTFTAKEKGKKIQYDVEIGMRWHGCSFWTIIRREGKVIYSDK
tara:strand:+ start:269 stop:511 length:243 start_codon:yes stop_codon:yes gene_type:complete